MGIIEAIAMIRAAIEQSSQQQDDAVWESAVAAAGLAPQGDKGQAGVDQEFLGTFGSLNLRVRHTCRDTSRTFSLGPDRTRVRLELRQGDVVLDSYTGGYEK